MNNKIDTEKYRDIKIWDILGIRFMGSRISIRCPFHHERTPSCVIYPDNSFYCFGCGEHGKGAIDFVMKMGYSFKEAINELDILIHK